MSDSISPIDGIGQSNNQANRYLWIALSVVFSTVVAQSLISQGLPVLYPFIQNEFGLSRAQVGLMTSSYAIGFGATVGLAGWLTDSFGVKRIITISLLGVTAFTLAFPLALSFSFILALAILIGIAASPLYPATTRAVMDWFPARIRAFAMSLKQTGFPIGGALTAIVFPTIAVLIGWRVAAAVTGLLVLVIAIMFMLLYRDTPRDREAPHKFNFTNLQTILRNRPLMTSIIWGTTISGLRYVTLTYIMLFLIEELGHSTIMAGGMLAVAQISSIIARVLWGAASDFVFHRRRIPVLAIIGFITVIWMLGASLISPEVPVPIIYLIVALIGISTLSYPGVLTTLLGEQAETGQVGVTVGLSSMLNHVTQILMPPLFGYLVDISSSYSLGWRTAAAIVLVCTLALLAFGREPQRR
ncbi:MFS transporter [Chloroflexota bacterium]